MVPHIGLLHTLLAGSKEVSKCVSSLKGGSRRDGFPKAPSNGRPLSGAFQAQSDLDAGSRYDSFLLGFLLFSFSSSSLICHSRALSRRYA